VVAGLSISLSVELRDGPGKSRIQHKMRTLVVAYRLAL